MGPSRKSGDTYVVVNHVICTAHTSVHDMQAIHANEWGRAVNPATTSRVCCGETCYIMDQMGLATSMTKLHCQQVRRWFWRTCAPSHAAGCDGPETYALPPSDLVRHLKSVPSMDDVNPYRPASNGNHDVHTETSPYEPSSK